MQDKEYMQNNEFDQLFRDKFEDAEVEPSLNLWAHIEEKLVVKPKRVFPVYWSAAAAVLVAVTIGLLFIKPDKIQLRTAVTVTQKTAMDPAGIAQQQISTASPHVKIGTEAGNAVEALTKVSVNSSAPSTIDAVTAQQSLKNSDVKGQVVSTDPIAAKKDLIAMQPSEVISHPDNKEPVSKKEIAKLPTVSLPVEEVVLASADVVKGDEENENKQAESGRIRNVGDLVNFVVDKVDKREEKFIQFKTEDDDSSLISLNIGMFRFNQKKHK